VSRSLLYQIIPDNELTMGVRKNSLWATAAVGTAIGFGFYPMAVLSSLIIFGLLASHHLSAPPE
jgi:hypothetical protein